MKKYKVRMVVDDIDIEWDEYPVYRFYVNGELCRNIMGKSGGWRYVAVTPQGDILKIDARAWEETCREAYRNQTMYEKRLYKKIQKSDRKYFPKIIQQGTIQFRNTTIHWMIQERIEFKAKPRYNKEHIRILDQLVERYGIEDLDYAKGQTIYASDNASIRKNGLPVIYDWGINSEV